MGGFVALDRCFHQELQPTGPGRQRRIDYALAHPAIAAMSVQHKPGPADHVAVRYDLDVQSHFRGFKLPRRGRFDAGLSSEQVAERFLAMLDPARLQEDLQQCNVDAAWDHLSSSAEFALGHDFELEPEPGKRATEPSPITLERSQPRTGRRGQGSRGLEGLRRLHRRLQQLQLEPTQTHLRRSILRSLRGLRELVPALDHLPESLDGAVEVVGALLQEYAQQEQHASFEQWSTRLEDNVVQQIAWVKKRADEAHAASKPPGPLAAIPAVHPVTVVREQGEVWKSKWTRRSDEPFDCMPLQRILTSLPRPEGAAVSLSITAEGLHKATKCMLHKACGPDQWDAASLLRLPCQFWEGLAAVWNQALSCGKVPRNWACVQVALLPKADNKTRPIGLCQLVWRAGARCLVKQLRPWASSWASQHVFGAVPGVSTTDCHIRLLEAWNRGVREYIKQGLSSFFDSISLEVLTPLLRHYGAPDALIEVLKSFYGMQRRCFRVAGYCSETFCDVNLGLLQGCPLSPVLAALVGQAWASYTTADSVHANAAIFIDDRVLWTAPHARDKVELFEAMLRRSDAFDVACGLTCEPTKCAFAHAASHLELVPLMRARNYTCLQSLEFLGVTFDLATAQGSPMRLDLSKALWRLRFLRRLGTNPRRLQQLLCPLVFAMLYWAGGVARPSAADELAVRNEVYAIFGRTFFGETPKIIIHEIFERKTEPRFLGDVSALRAVSRFLARRPAWREHLPLADAFSTWMAVLPDAKTVVEGCGWEVRNGGKTLCRVDDQGQVRLFHFGHDNFQVLHQWLVLVYRERYLQACGRVQQSLHRGGPEATGLALPKPARGLRYAFQGHREAAQASTLCEQWRAAFCTGGSIWYHLGSRARHTPEDSPLRACLCGSVNPSRAHMMWTCPSTASLRRQVAMPQDRAGERLMAHHTPE